jgi:hypothetical protein
VGKIRSEKNLYYNFLPGWLGQIKMILVSRHLAEQENGCAMTPNIEIPLFIPIPTI